MLEVLTSGFKKAKLKFSGKAELSEDNINEALVEIRRSLLEGDVDYNVVKSFLKNVKDKAIGEIVKTKVNRKGKLYKASPGDHFIKICQEELEALMGPVDAALNLRDSDAAPSTIMMIGLQGVGKTTISGKLAKYLKETKKRNPMLVAADVYRPAAIEQLKVLGKKIDVFVYSEDSGQPVKICSNALEYAKYNHFDTVIFDTAGRLAIDENMMNELAEIKSSVHPDNILLVCDAMIGQDAVTTAKVFDEKLTMSGFILTKLDGDARGGAALSIKEVTGKPIKFLGTGEGLEALEEFRPEGLASRILGMGDVVGLMKDFEKVVDQEEAEEDAMRMLKGSFSFYDFKKQIGMIQKMGPMADLLGKLPFGDMLPKGAMVDENGFKKVVAMINSMTHKERLEPSIINKSRMARISKGSGRDIREVEDLVSKFFQMRKMMNMFASSSGLLGKIPGMGGGLGGMMNKMRNTPMGNLANLDQASIMAEAQAREAQRQSQLKKVDKDKERRKRKDARKSRKKQK